MLCVLNFTWCSTLCLVALASSQTTLNINCRTLHIIKLLCFILNVVMAHIITHNELVNTAMAHNNVYATSWRTETLSLVQLNLMYSIIVFEMTEDLKHILVAAESSHGQYAQV